jgi:hypothetical protein
LGCCLLWVLNPFYLNPLNLLLITTKKYKTN